MLLYMHMHMYMHYVHAHVVLHLETKEGHYSHFTSHL